MQTAIFVTCCIVAMLSMYPDVGKCSESVDGTSNNEKPIEDYLEPRPLIEKLEAAPDHHLYYHFVIAMYKETPESRIESDTMNGVHSLIQLRRYDPTNMSDKNDLSKIFLIPGTDGGMALSKAENMINDLDNLDSATGQAKYSEYKVGDPSNVQPWKDGTNTIILHSWIYEPADLYNPGTRQSGRFLRSILVEDSDDKIFLKPTYGKQNSGDGSISRMYSMTYGNYLVVRISYDWTTEVKWRIYKQCGSQVEDEDKELEIIRALVRKAIIGNDGRFTVVRVWKQHIGNSDVCSNERFTKLLTPKPRPVN